jgi:ribosomal protein S18 acetylase RimI-like enzyme
VTSRHALLARKCHHRLGPPGLPDPGREPGIRIRPMAAADLERVSELRRSVRWCTSPGAFDLVLRSIRSARWAVAEPQDGLVVGMVGAVPLGEVGVLCHLAVHPAHRGLGLGTRLSRWATSYLRSRGTRVVRLDSTREAEGLYEALGFRAVGRRVLYRLEGKRRALYPPGRGHRAVSLTPGDLAELYGVDRRSYGGDRSALLAAIVEGRHGSGLVARDAEGSMTGFLLRSGTLLGPWTASTPEAARALVVRELARGVWDRTEVMAPAGGPSHRLLKELGFVGVPDRLRMELGTLSRAYDSLETYGLSPYLIT